MANPFYLACFGAMACIASQGVVAATSATTTTVAEQSSSATVGSVEQRLSRIERLLDNQVMLDMLQRVESLQQEIRELRGEIESQGFELQSMRKRQRDLYLDTDRRLRDVELAGGATNSQSSSDVSDSGSNVGVSTAAPSTSVSVTQSTTESSSATNTAAASSADPVQEKAAYTQAFNYLKEGRYEKAIKAFSKFLLDYPNGNYSDNAQYWLGEANYVSRFFDEAIRQFSVVLAKYPSSPKTSDARLKIGYAYYETENWEAATSTLSALANDFPGTSVAKLANKRLARMREEGH